MIEINLLPDVKRDLLKAQRARNLVTFFSIVIGASMVGLTVLVLIFVQGQQLIIGENTKSIDKEFNDMKNIQDGETAATLRNQLNSIQEIRNASPNTSRIITQIAGAISTKGDNEVTYSSISYDPATRLMTIEGQTSKGYSALEAFLKTIRSSQIIYKVSDKESENPCSQSKVDSNSEICLLADTKTVEAPEQSFGDSSTGGKVLRFKVNFNLNEAALKFETKDFKIKSLSKKDVTDSTIQVPTGIFQEDTTKEKKDGK